MEDRLILTGTPQQVHDNLALLTVKAYQIGIDTVAGLINELHCRRNDYATKCCDPAILEIGGTKWTKIC